MNGKRKNYLENTIILAVVGSILYSIYSLLFSTDTIKEEIPIQKPIPNLIVQTKSEKFKPKIKVIEEIKPIMVDIKKDIKIKKIENKLPIETKIQAISKSTNTTKSIEFSTQEQKDITNIFSKDTKSKIQNNISNQSKLKVYNSMGYVKIRVTIFKDGNFEHLKYMGGDKEYFDSIKDSIKSTFPVYIDEQIKYQFPRYFRMRINY